MLLLLLTTLSVARAAPDAADIARARLQQEALPALDARASAAGARAEAAQSWFDGAASFEAAFPSLIGQPVDDPAWLTARLLLLQEGVADRAAERIAAPPTDLSDRDRDRFLGARAAALDAEDAAAALEQRLLAGLRAGYRKAPGLAGPEVEAALAEISRARAALGEPDPTAEGWQEAAAQVAALGSRAAALELYRAATRRALTIAGDASLAALVRADQARLGDPATEAPAADRLRRALPLLDSAQQEAIRDQLFAAEMRTLEAEAAALTAQAEALRGELGAIDATDLTEGVPVYERRLQRATQERVALEQAAPAAADPLAPAALVDLRAKVRMQQTELAQLAEDLARRRLTRAKRLEELGLAKESLTAEDITAAEKRAAEAAVKAEEARKGAQRADRLVAEALSAALDAGVRQVQHEQARQEAVEGELSGFEESLEAVQVAREDALALPPLDARRPSALQKAWRDSESLVARTRSALQERSRGCKKAAAFDEELLDSLPIVPADVRTQVADDLTAQLDEEVSALERRAASRLQACRAEVGAVMAVLSEAKAARRHIESAAPQAVSRTTDDVLVELWDEVKAIPVRLEGLFWRMVQLDPRSFSLEDQIGWLLGLALGSIEVLLVVAVWALLRRLVPTLSVDLVKWMADRRGGLGGRLTALQRFVVPGDPALLREPLQPVLREAIDAVAGLLTFWLLKERAPLLALPVLIWTGRQLVALAPNVVALALGLRSERRPCLRQVDPEVRDLGRSTARALALWWVALQVLTFVTLDLLDADRFTQLMRASVMLAGLIVTLGLLSQWWGPIRLALSTQEQNQVTQVLTREVRSPVLRAPVAAAGLVVLAERWLVQVGTRLVETRAGLAWLGAALARQRLRDSDAMPTLPPLPADLLETLAGPAHPELRFDDQLAELHKGFVGWREEQRRGMAAVIGGRGSGKSHLIHHFRESLPDGVQLVTLDPPPRCHEVEPALRWLARSLDVEVAADDVARDEAGDLSSALADALLERPPMVIVVDDTQRFFLRAVGGFRALRRVLGVMHATSERHFWVCSFHGPAWWFLAGVAQVVNLAVFRTRVHMPALDPPRLAGWLEARLASVGRTMDFGSLVQEGAVDHLRAVERARTAYWLLLADESAGNPRAALGYWLTSLRDGDAPDTVRVTRFVSPKSEALDSATDRDLFVLTALSLHDFLGVPDLAETLNLPSGVCRATCRHLEALGVLESDRGSRTYQVRQSWQPVVDKVLRQKQFLHGR